MPADFDLQALHTALDTRRTALGLSWSAVGTELGISVATLRALGTRPTAEGDGVLRVLAWVGRSAESFVGDHRGAAGEAWSPPGPAGKLRFDAPVLYAALNRERVARRKTWQEVATATGFGSASSLTRLEDGGRVMFPAVMGIFSWLGMPAARFVRVVRR